MRVIKNIFSQLHTFVLWALMSVLVWGFVFNFVTDTTPDKKVTVFCYVSEVQDTALAAKLEETMPEGLRMIKVHPFDYVMFDVDSLAQGDIFILPASTVAQFAGDLAGVGDAPYVPVHDAASGASIAADYITYTNEDYYLFLGANSVHLEDGKALAVALALLELE